MNITMTQVFFPINESEILPFLAIIEFYRKMEEKHVYRNSQEKLGPTTSGTVTLDSQRTISEQNEIVPQQ